MTPESIIELLERAAKAMELSPVSVGRYASGSGDFYRRLRSGHDITSRRAARVLGWLSDNWPESTVWPADIPRPTPTPDSPAAAPEPVIDDPLSAVRELKELIDEAQLASDWEAAKRHELAKFNAAATLRADGRIASVDAICEALGCARYVYDDVVRRYAGRPASVKPRNLDSPVGRMLTLLEASGDHRFAHRRSHAA